MPEYRPTKEMVEREELDRRLRAAYEASESKEEYRRQAAAIEKNWEDEKRIAKDHHHI